LEIIGEIIGVSENKGIIGNYWELLGIIGIIGNYWGQSKINSKSERRMGEL
jgi:hypothetical protein